MVVAINQKHSTGESRHFPRSSLCQSTSAVSLMADRRTHKPQSLRSRSKRAGSSRLRSALSVRLPADGRDAKKIRRTETLVWVQVLSKPPNLTVQTQKSSQTEILKSGKNLKMPKQTAGDRLQKSTRQQELIMNWSPVFSWTWKPSCLSSQWCDYHAHYPQLALCQLQVNRTMSPTHTWIQMHVY